MGTITHNMCLGVFDQDLKAEYSFKFPQLYLMGIRNDKFTTWRFCLTVVDAIYQSAVCFGLPYMVFIGPKLSSEGYETEGVTEFGTFIAGIAVVVANTLVGLTIFSWTWIMFLCIIISSATFFIWTGIYSHIMSFTFYGEVILFGEGTFWLCLILTFVVCLLPRFATIYYLQVYSPYDNDIIREIVLCDKNSPLANMNKFLRGNDQKEGFYDEEEEALNINLTRTRSIDQRDHPLNMMYSDSDIALTESKKSKKFGSGRFGLYRSSTTDSTKSEIMNMKTGKRSSFTGFAYSSDDNHVFDDFRKSVYRTNSNHVSHPNISSRLSMISLPPTDENSKENGKDWMPIDGFRLRQYDTAPSLFSSSSNKKGSGFGKKMMKAMKNRIVQPNYKKHNQQQSRLDTIVQTRDSSMDSSMQGSVFDSSTMLLPLTPNNQESFVAPSVPPHITDELYQQNPVASIQPLQPFLLHQHNQSSHHDPQQHQPRRSDNNSPPDPSSSSSSPTYY